MPASATSVANPPAHSGHGGFRVGAGRKPVLIGATKRTYVMTTKTLSQLNAWQSKHGDCTISEAIRQMVDAAANPEALAREVESQRKRAARAAKKTA